MRTDIKTLYIDFDGTLVNTIESIAVSYTHLTLPTNSLV